MSLNDLTPLAGTFAKTAIVIFFVVYSIFAFLMSKQVNLMTRTLEVGFETVLKIISLLHFALSLVLLILAFILL